MCTVSMVHDAFTPKFEPYRGLDWTGVFTNVPNSIAPEVAEFKNLLAEFKAALKAAKFLDKVLDQPDCVDPEKAKLEDRVLALEKQIKKLTAAAKKKSL